MTTVPKKKGGMHDFLAKKTLPYIAKAKIDKLEPDLFKAIKALSMEIYTLLNNPLTRYKRTNEYKRFIKPSKYDEVSFFKWKTKVEKDPDRYARELKLAKKAATGDYWKIPVRKYSDDENASFGGSLQNRIHGVEYDVLFTRTYMPSLEGGFNWFLIKCLKQEFSSENGLFLAHISNLTTQTTVERVEAYFQRLYIGMVLPGSGMEINVAYETRQQAFAAYNKIVAKYTLLVDIPYNHQGHVHQVAGGKSKIQDDGNINVDPKRGEKFDRERAMTLDEAEIPFVDDSYIESLGDMPESTGPSGVGVGLIAKSIPKKPTKKTKKLDTLKAKKVKSKSKLTLDEPAPPSDFD